MKKLLLLGVAFVFSTLLFAQNTNQNLLSPIGNVGIGTTSPSEKLSVFGNSEMNGRVLIKDDLILEKLKENTPTQVLERYLIIDKDGKVGRGEIIHPGGNPLDGIIRNSWTLNGNNNTTSSNFIGTKDNAPLIFKTNNVERLRVLSNETKVGIGTSSPEATLHVNGNTILSGTLEVINQLKIGTSSLYLGSSTSGTAGTQNYIRSTNGPLKINGIVTGISDGLRNTLINPNGGMVGIGTSNPTKALHVYTYHNLTVDPQEPDDAFTIGDAEHHSHYGIRLEDKTIAADGNVVNTLWDIEPFNKNLVFGKPEQPFVVMTHDNKMGIGTTTPHPAATLHVGSYRAITMGSTGGTGSNTYGEFVGFNAVIAPPGSGGVTTSSITKLAGGTGSGGDQTGGVILKSENDGTFCIQSFNTANATGEVNGIQFKPQYIFKNDGTLKVKGEVVVEAKWSDYVFEPTYELMSLHELENYLVINKHLPNIPPASEIETEGLSVGFVQSKMMEKIEEQALYIIELNKRLEQMENQIQELSKK